jgi:hypothetical protein
VLPPNADAFRPFDARAREELLLALASGRARSAQDACEMLGLSWRVVLQWLQRGKRVHEGAIEPDGAVYHGYYLRYLAALGEVRRTARQVLVDESRTNWKAALEVLQLEQREALQTLELKTARAHARRASAMAKTAQIEALLALAKVHKRNGRLYWPAEVLDRMSAEERAVLEAFMMREGFVRATRKEAEEEAAMRSQSADEDVTALAREWGLISSPDEENPSEGSSP